MKNCRGRDYQSIPKTGQGYQRRSSNKVIHFDEGGMAGLLLPHDLRLTAKKVRKSMKSLEERITQLEMMVTHLQQTLSDLDQSIIEQHRYIDQMQREIQRIATDFRSSRDTAIEVRRPEDEIPPHY